MSQRAYEEVEKYMYEPWFYYEGVTKEELQLVAIDHSITYIGGVCYLGAMEQIPELAQKEVVDTRPVVAEPVAPATAKKRRTAPV